MLGTVGRRLGPVTARYSSPLRLDGGQRRDSGLSGHNKQPDLLGYLGVGVLVLVPLAAAGFTSPGFVLGPRHGAPL